MTPRTLLALGAAALAFSAGALAFDGVTGIGVETAVAAETSHDAAPVRVTKADLRSVDSIELDAEALVLRDGDDTVVKSSMRDSGLTVSLLNRLLGTPSRTQTAEGDGGACFPAGTTYTWGGAIRVAALTTDAAAGNAVEIRVLRDSVRSMLGGRIDLTGPHGVQVGDDIADEIADAPRSERVSYGSDDSRAWQLLLREGWAAEPDDERAEQDTDESSTDEADSGTNGVSALTNETTVTVLGSPMPVHAQRSC
ncbi:hypothetical protein [Curtobacterium aurantiacum]|uniref:hypothetical protein n=1 Tax=Curtobacterium aurantiacum TaxID=3236919 RepID=UPI001BDDF58A|nr:hypothetical protein [Curtobacterium flaccumfaciens]MBT1677457.1 hypothetical protein [Curtobacterium flaccumfaciens pv. flaccumfaciens]MBT1679900.1 hypothetical protein [Curtobacterium flaccumfaciens pv. flaccumfaciens]